MAIVYSRAGGVVSATVDGDVVLMAPTDARCYALRGSADAVWSALDEPRTTTDLVDRCVARFRVERDRCRVDVEALLAAMVAAGVVSATGS